MMTGLKRVRAMTAFVLAGFAAGCAGDPVEQLFVQPGRFDYLSCQDLVTAQRDSAKREQELKILIGRAEQESVGVLLAIASYRGELVRVQGEQKMQAEVIQRKKCPPDTAPRPPEAPKSKLQKPSR
jgi:hypothetical protein